jgi:hypothetical protein
MFKNIMYKKNTCKESFLSINLIIDNPNSFIRRQNDDIYVVKLNVHVCL